MGALRRSGPRVQLKQHAFSFAGNVVYDGILS
jgi:hypothetical protein